MRNLLILALLVHCTCGHAQTDVALAEWQTRWQNSLAYTLEALDLVDETDLDFRPTPDQMSVHGQLRHLAGNIYGLSVRYLGHRPEGYDSERVRTTLRDETLTKEELREIVTAAYAFGSEAVKALDPHELDERVDFFAGPKTRRQIVALLQDHATHHRAQVLVYLRLLGLAPPRYRGW